MRGGVNLGVGGWYQSMTITIKNEEVIAKPTRRVGVPSKGSELVADPLSNGKVGTGSSLLLGYCTPECNQRTVVLHSRQRRERRAALAAAKEPHSPKRRLGTVTDRDNAVYGPVVTPLPSHIRVKKIHNVTAPPRLMAWWCGCAEIQLAALWHRCVRSVTGSYRPWGLALCPPCDTRHRSEECKSANRTSR